MRNAGIVISRMTAVTMVWGLLSGCAFMKAKNTPLFNTVEEHLWPAQRPMQIAAFPAVFPIGAAALATDAVVVHPLMVIDDAAEAAEEDLWYGLEWEKSWLGASMGLTWRVAWAPVNFASCHLYFALCDGPRRPRRALIQARKLMDEGRPSEALQCIDTSLRAWRSWSQDRLGEEERQQIDGLRLRAALSSGQYGAPMELGANGLFKGEVADGIRDVLAEMRRSDVPWQRWCALSLELSRCSDEGSRASLLVDALRDGDTVIRSQVLRGILVSYATPNPDSDPDSGSMCKRVRFWGGWSPGASSIPAVLPIIDHAASEDPEPMNRALAVQAANCLRQKLREAGK